MTMIETWLTSDGATIEVHDTPPEAYGGEATDIGHLRAHNSFASVVLPISKAMLTDDPAIKRYVKVRLLLFLRLETERVEAEGATQ